MRKDGFTLLEVLIVGTILVFLASGAATSFSRFTQDRALAAAGETALSLLRTARDQTLAARGDTSYGVYFASSTITLFSGLSYTQGAPGNTVVSLDSRVMLAQVSLSDGGSDVRFTRLTGEARESGTVAYSLVSDPARRVEVLVSPSGLSEIN